MLEEVICYAPCVLLAKLDQSLPSFILFSNTIFTCAVQPPVMKKDIFWKCFFQKVFQVFISSVQSLVSDSLRPHESQHARPPCLLLPPIPPSIRVFSNESTLRIEDYFIVKSKPQPRVIYFGKVFNSQWVKAKGVPLLTLSYLKTGTKIEPFSSLRTFHDKPQYELHNFYFLIYVVPIELSCWCYQFTSFGES